MTLLRSVSAPIAFDPKGEWLAAIFPHPDCRFVLTKGVPVSLGTLPSSLTRGLQEHGYPRAPVSLTMTGDRLLRWYDFERMEGVAWENQWNPEFVNLPLNVRQHGFPVLTTFASQIENGLAAYSGGGRTVLCRFRPHTAEFQKRFENFDGSIDEPFARTERYFNTLVLLGPDGRILIHYRKRNPWMWAERGWATEGDLGLPVADTPWGRVGLLICFDIHQQAALMAERRIDLLLYSIAWVEREGSDWFEKQLPAIARKHRFAIVAANWTVPAAPPPTWRGYGQSRVIDAGGNILARAESDLDEAIVLVELPVRSPQRGRDY